MGLIAISVYGEDKIGIIHEISKALADCKCNIVDIEQTVLQGMFVMFIVAELGDEKCVMQKLSNAAKRIDVKISISPFARRRLDKKNLYVVTVLGEDRIGIVRDITKTFLELEINIERTSLTARDKLISIEFVIDMGNNNPKIVKEILKRESEKLDLDIVIQPYDLFKKEKRLIVFDMDSTLVDAEIIDELAKEAGVLKEVKNLTNRAMEGKISFKEALKERVKLLEGLPVEVLEKIYSKIKLTDGAKELIKSLKDAGYKVAVISGGFSYFTEKLKDELNLDYAFGNELEIKNGKVTGRIRGRIIDAQEKARIIEEIAKREGIKTENIVAVGDGANDKLMIEKAGLGIAFNAKEILKEAADGNISKRNLIGIASILKLPSEFRKRI
ncbi:phosphoserine phosphatase SerB [Archaeoglobales archaeon ex4484_92]|nr:MAG: phosphoserine phosphatase SerB [Archaeoglobales archaeon ex4484_92]